MDACDNCKRKAELYHNEATGLSFCETCDAFDETTVRTKVYDASKAQKGVTLTPYETELLWGSYFEQAVKALKLSATRAPLVPVSELRRGDRIIVPASNGNRGGFAVVEVERIDSDRVYVDGNPEFPVWYDHGTAHGKAARFEA